MAETPTPQKTPKTQNMLQRKLITRRGSYEILRSQLMQEKSTFLPYWRDLGDYILARRPRFTVTDNNKGDKRNQKIIDSTATLAARTLRSGMMSGITSPARPWFRLMTPDPEVADIMEVRDWLDDVTQRMSTVFLRSNLYNVLPIIYGDIGVFATAAMMIEEDDDDVVRFYPFPIGSYMLVVDVKGRVRGFYREFRLTVNQLIEKFGGNGDEPDWTKFSDTVKNLWINNQGQSWVEVAHVIMPNDEYDNGKLASKYKKYRSCYYERGQSQGASNYYTLNEPDRFLRESGYDNFPILAPRWEINAEDVYGTTCPGMDCLGDVKALQLMHRRKAQAIEKMVNPPMVAPSAMRANKASILPGDITYTDTREGQQGFRPAHEVNPQVDKLLLDIAAHQDRIRRSFFEDLFLMLSMSDRREITAREIEERHEEKLLALGPVLEQLNQDLLDPLINIVFNIMLQKNMIPEPPQQLQGTDLRVEYVSVMAQAQKLVGIATLERFGAFIGSLLKESQDPSVLDKVDMDEFIDKYGDRLSVPPGIIRSDDDVQAIRTGRAQAQKAKAAQEMMSNMGKTAKDLSQADTNGPNALTDLLSQANAGGIAPTQ